MVYCVPHRERCKFNRKKKKWVSRLSLMLISLISIKWSFQMQTVFLYFCVKRFVIAIYQWKLNHGFAKHEL